MLKQAREHLLCDTEFSDALNVICATLTQPAYLTKFASLAKHVSSLSKLMDELQNINTLDQPFSLFNATSKTMSMEKRHI